MRGLVAVARLEVVQRRAVFPAALLLGFFPLLAPLLPSVHSHATAQIHLVAAGFVAALFAAILSLSLGSSTIGRDLTEKRIGFYFARPLSAFAIWGGRFLGVWAIVVGAVLLILLPAGALDASSWWRLAGGGDRVAQMALAFGGGVLMALAAGNLVSLAVRARSVWGIADLVLLCVFVPSLGLVSSPLIRAGAPILLTRVAIGLAAGVAVALLAGSFAQVAVGRIDVARGNRGRFIVLWALLFVVAGVGWICVRGLTSIRPQDLRPLVVGAGAAKGDWIEIEGRARGHADLAASFFYDLGTRQFVAFPAGPQTDVVLSADGRSAVWTRRSILPWEGRTEVSFCRLASGRLLATPIAERIWNLALSSDGSRLALLHEETVSVFEVPSGRLLAAAAATAQEHQALRLTFLDRDRLRLYRMGPVGAARSLEDPKTAAIEVMDLNVPAHRLTRISEIRGLRRPFSLAFDDRDARIIAWEEGGSVTLFDAASAARLATLAPAGCERGSRAFLWDGRPVLAEATDGRGRVHLFSTSGAPEKTFDVGPAGTVRIGAEPAAGQLTLSIGLTPGQPYGPADAFLLDLQTGSLRKLAAHAEPIAARMHWRLPSMEPGSGATRILEREDGAFLHLDPVAGSLTSLLSGR